MGFQYIIWPYNYSRIIIPNKTCRAFCTHIWRSVPRKSLRRIAANIWYEYIVDRKARNHRNCVLCHCIPYHRHYGERTCGPIYLPVIAYLYIASTLLGDFSTKVCGGLGLVCRLVGYFIEGVTPGIALEMPCYHSDWYVCKWDCLNKKV